MRNLKIEIGIEGWSKEETINMRDIKLEIHSHRYDEDCVILVIDGKSYVVVAGELI